jgi:hypothetical protein
MEQTALVQIQLQSVLFGAELLEKTLRDTHLAVKLPLYQYLHSRSWMKKREFMMVFSEETGK